MSEAFIYMYVLGSGAAAGVGTIVIIMYFLYQKLNNRKPKSKARF